ncbi:hypothetical protein PCANC_23696 [Puccinia coronata f. sp. avenae]|uniref:Integrase catalytic domain-containing protein n=1 Tax=Puccinia coronata f. sp. avenae TaxID=200324 RepID=A0A2N5UDG2_9BASI|nr:hypothetical protein PCANC_23696 [Puccinia coronata f. sp. avenae]
MAASDENSDAAIRARFSGSAADPPTRRPDFLPSGEEEDPRQILISASAEGLHLQGSSLDDFDPCLDVGEVVSSDSSFAAAPARTDLPWRDLSFCPPSAQFKSLLASVYQSPDFQSADEDGLEFKDGLWWIHDRLFVPKSLRSRVLKDLHDEATSGHPGSLKTLDLVTRTMYWPGVCKDVLSYVKSCFSCQQAKHSNQHPLPVPPRPWSTIGIDFVMKLPLSAGFDSVLVIVDHLTKGIHLVAAKETWDAEEFAFVFLDRFIRLHGLPDRIVSDQGSLFISKFWREVQRLMRISPAPSTAWHPRTDGQTERVNQTFETYLRHFVSDRQDDWYQLLPLAELVFNNSVLASTGYSPFFSQFAFHPRVNTLTEASTVPAAESFLSTLNKVHELLIDNLVRAKEVQRTYFNRRAREGPTFKSGDWVWLLRRNIASTRPSGKLNYKRLGPFRMDQALGKDFYRLILPSDLSRIHPVFHTSLLLPFCDPQDFPNRLGSRAPRGPASLNPIRDFWGEQDVEAIIGYWVPVKSRKTTHDYWCVGGGAPQPTTLGSRGGCSPQKFTLILNCFMTPLVIKIFGYPPTNLFGFCVSSLLSILS